MSKTLSLRIPEHLAKRLEEQSRLTGRSRGSIVKDSLEQTLRPTTKPYMELAGSIEGPPDLSKRKGFAD